MKYFLLLLFTISAGKSFSQLDTVQCSDQLPSYINDAKYLALRVIDSTNSPYVDSVIIPASYYLPILRDIDAIAQLGNLRINSQYPYANTIDSIFWILNVHARAEVQASLLSVNSNGSFGWVQNIFNDSIYSGNDTLDNLVNQYGLYISSPYKVYDWYYFSISATYPINMAPIMNTIATMAETYATYGQVIGDASDIYLVDSGYVRHYTFRYGGGDCPSGCDIYYVWEFSVYNGCIVKFDTSYYSDYTRLTYGIHNINVNKLTVYPNPSTGLLNISTENIQDGTSVEVYDLLGEKIYQSAISRNTAEINLSGRAPGTYLYRISGVDGSSSAGTFIIQ